MRPALLKPYRETSTKVMVVSGNLVVTYHHNFTTTR